MNKNFHLGDLLKKLAVRASILILIFIIATVFGYITYEKNKELIQEVIRSLVEKNIDKRSKIRTSLNIFLNNLFSSLVAYIGGFFIFLPALVVFINGFFLGSFLRYLLETKRKDVIFLFKGIIPHGIFELPAFFLAASLGIYVAENLILSLYRLFLISLRKGNFKETLRQEAGNISTVVKETTVIFLLFVLPLLLVAAIVEVFITSQLLGIKWFS